MDFKDELDESAIFVEGVDGTSCGNAIYIGSDTDDDLAAEGSASHDASSMGPSDSHAGLTASTAILVDDIEEDQPHTSLLEIPNSSLGYRGNVGNEVRNAGGQSREPMDLADDLDDLYVARPDEGPTPPQPPRRRGRKGRGRLQYLLCTEPGSDSDSETSASDSDYETLPMAPVGRQNAPGSRTFANRHSSPPPPAIPPPSIHTPRERQSSPIRGFQSRRAEKQAYPRPPVSHSQCEHGQRVPLPSKNYARGRRLLLPAAGLPLVVVPMRGDLQFIDPTTRCARDV